MNHEVEKYEGELRELREENTYLKDRIKDLETTVAYVEKELQEFGISPQKSVDFRIWLVYNEVLYYENVDK